MSVRILVIVRNDSSKKSLSMSFREVLPEAQVFWAKDMQAAEAEFDKQKLFKFVFVENGFRDNELISLVSMAKRSAAGGKARIILLVTDGKSEDETLARHLSLGFSGMLVEPFSIESVKEVTQLSECLTMAGSIARLTVATGLQIRAHLVKEKRMRGSGHLLESVKKACQIFETDNPGTTVRSVAEEMSYLSLEDRVKINIRHIYRGVSERVKKLIDKKN